MTLQEIAEGLEIQANLLYEQAAMLRTMHQVELSYTPPEVSEARRRIYEAVMANRAKYQEAEPAPVGPAPEPNNENSEIVAGPA